MTGQEKGGLGTPLGISDIRAIRIDSKRVVSNQIENDEFARQNSPITACALYDGQIPTIRGGRRKPDLTPRDVY
ncbi:MAG: hypothetical protein ACREP9_21475, partial [Candidatus Dormibacteraceae bacterium]